MLGTAPVHNGNAVYSTSALNAGAYSITAAYGGDTAFSASTSSPYSLSIIPEGVHLDLSGSPNPAEIGSDVTFTTNVTAAQGSPGGSVTLLEGSTALGAPVAVSAGGVATFHTNSLAVGTHSITAYYSGTPNFLPAVSAAMQETIVPFIGDFSILASPVSRSVYPGELTSFKVNVAAKGGFHQTLVLSCAGLPQATTCTFNAPSIADGSGASTLVIQTTGAHEVTSAGAAARKPWGTGLEGTALRAGFMASLAFLVLPRQLRRHGSCWSLRYLP